MAVKKKATKASTAEKPATERAAGGEQERADETEAQREMREYHEGEFQTHDPISGEERDLDEKPRVARVDRGETVEDLQKDADK